MKEAFELIRAKLEAKEDDCGCGKITVQDALSIISEVEAEYGNGWIPCSERLPEDNTRVLGCFATGTVTELAYLGEGIFSGLYVYTTKVIIAWMPLPSPYKPTTD